MSQGARPTRRAVAAGLAALAPVCAWAAAPRRIVSLNACLDAILLETADERNVAALSQFARSPTESVIADRARRLPSTHESAEEILALRPDLVLASRHTALATRKVLQRLGVPLAVFDVPNTVAESLAQVRRIASLVGRPDRGEALAARIKAALAAAAPRPNQPRLTAAVFQPYGLAAGDGTLAGEMMSRCGFDNVAARYGVRLWGNIGLERLVADPPQVLLAGQAAPGAPTWGERVVSHPALRRVAHKMHRADFPQRLLYCGGPTLILTAAALAKAREDALKDLAA